MPADFHPAPGSIIPRALRPPTIAGLFVGLLTAPVLAQDSVPPTPNEGDIPSPVPVEMSLAGDPLPDITRFLNVRSAGGASLSPDGSRLAFRTSITGEPQLWVVDAEGGWPRQLTFGEAVTLHEWSPAGDGILYGSDRGGDEREGYWLISPDGTRERELLPPSDAFRSFGSFTRDGSALVYGSTQRNGVDFDIHLLEIETGRDRIEYGDIDDPADRTFFETISPITYVDGDEAPVMVLHGANDPRDPVTESDQFVRAIRERGGEVQYLRFPDEGHGIRKLENRIIAYRRIAAWLEEKLEVRRPAVF